MDQLTVKRYQKLFGTKYISQQDYDTAVATAAEQCGRGRGESGR
jgi:membrane fusion protein (multidrug efflux system)